MSQDSQDVKPSDKEDYLHVGKVDLQFVPPKSLEPRRFRGRYLVLVLLGLTCVIATAVIVFGVTGWAIGSNIGAIRKDIKSANQTIIAELISLEKEEVKDEQKFTKVDKMVKNMTQEMKEVKTQLQEQISKLHKSIQTTNCNLEDIKHNRTGGICCPKGWRLFDRNCYWFSKTTKSWDEAKADCEAQESHLVTITSYKEQQFVALQAKPRHTWIGLSFVSGSWKWVDGATYTIRRADWRPGEPNNYSFHVAGEPAHCAHIYSDGLWSDEHCSRQYYWACEAGTKG
uniref:C-type lectin domain-containing protein n=1 Tax=Salvator merianae TaxID=96440 RepID=A0A8D0DK22_SALMN